MSIIDSLAVALFFGLLVVIGVIIYTLATTEPERHYEPNFQIDTYEGIMKDPETIIIEFGPKDEQSKNTDNNPKAE